MKRPFAGAVAALALVEAALGLRTGGLVANDTSVIPHIVFVTGPWNPISVVEQSRQVMPKGTEFRYYNYSHLERSVGEISLLLEREGIKGASEALHELRPRAYRSDLWRYMVLWRYGGIYLDAKVVLKAPLSKWVDEKQDSLVLCHDIDPPSSYWSGLLASRAGNPALLVVIRKIISNVQRRTYGFGQQGDLEITGPGALTQALQDAGVKPRVSCHLEVQHGGVKRLTIQDIWGSRIAETSWQVHSAMKDCTNCDSYSDLYKRHQVYCSERGPACKFSLLSQPDDGKPYMSWTV